MAKGFPWTSADDAELARLIAAGASRIEMQRALARTEAAIANRITRLKLARGTGHPKVGPKLINVERADKAVALYLEFRSLRKVSLAVGAHKETVRGWLEAAGVFVRRVNRSDLAASARPTARRKCLKCRTIFVSSHAGNRVCDKCKRSDDWRHGHIWFGVSA